MYIYNYLLVCLLTCLCIDYMTRFQSPLGTEIFVFTCHPDFLFGISWLLSNG